VINLSDFQIVLISGFIGGHLARRLLSMPSARRLVTYDNFSSGQENCLAYLVFLAGAGWLCGPKWPAAPPALD
jgi:nucleoside-diphosphate-sugar epimerase